MREVVLAECFGAAADRISIRDACVICIPAWIPAHEDISTADLHRAYYSGLLRCSRPSVRGGAG